MHSLLMKVARRLQSFHSCVCFMKDMQKRTNMYPEKNAFNFEANIKEELSLEVVLFS